MVVKRVENIEEITAEMERSHEASIFELIKWFIIDNSWSYCFEDKIQYSAFISCEIRDIAI